MLDIHLVPGTFLTYAWHVVQLMFARRYVCTPFTSVFRVPRAFLADQEEKLFICQVVLLIAAVVLFPVVW